MQNNSTFIKICEVSGLIKFLHNVTNINHTSNYGLRT